MCSGCSNVLKCLRFPAGRIADSLAGTERDDQASALFEVERSLLTAGRRLSEVVEQLNR